MSFVTKSAENWLQNDNRKETKKKKKNLPTLEVQWLKAQANHSTNDARVLKTKSLTGDELLKRTKSIMSYKYIHSWQIPDFSF